MGIQQARKTSDSIWIRTGSSPSSEAYVIFPVEQQLDPREHGLLEITMKTDPRIHRFKFLWKPTGAGQPDMSYFVQQPIYRDGGFHTYVIPLDIRPSWKDRISEIALGWGGTHGLVEIKRVALRPIRSWDRLRASWSQFWIPEALNPAMANAVGGPALCGQPLALLLTLLFVVFFSVIYLAYRHRLVGTRPTAGTSSVSIPDRTPPWLYPAALTFLIFWLLYDLRETYDHVQTLRSEFRYSLGGAPRPRHYFELDDFYEFIDAVKTVVPPESPVGFFSSRPLFVKARYFLFPQPVLDRAFHSDYLVVFQDPTIAFSNGRVTEKGTVLSDRVTPFGRFGEDAFIFKRTHD